MTACFAALSDERVDAGQGRLLCLGRRGDGAPDAAPRRLQFRDGVAAWATEGEGDDRRLLPTEQLELRLPVVVGPSWLADSDAVPRGLAGEADRRTPLPAPRRSARGLDRRRSLRTA